MADYNPYDTLFSDEEMAQFNRIMQKKWVRVDPNTKKAFANSKDLFWEVDNMCPMSKFGEDMNKPKMNFKVQAYYRRRTYEAATDQKGGKTTRNMAYHEVNDRGELLKPGFLWVDSENFPKHFVEDK